MLRSVEMIRRVALNWGVKMHEIPFDADGMAAAL